MMGLLTTSQTQWAIIAALITAIGTVVGIWFKGAPDRKHAHNEEAIIAAGVMDKLLADYGQQVDKFRAEVACLRTELHASDRISQQRNERISTMELIIELLITELERIDPDGKANPVIRQARIMFRHISILGEDPTQSHQMNLALHIQADAHQTVMSADHNVRDIAAAEAAQTLGDGDPK